MKEITRKEIDRIEEGTELYDKIAGRYVRVTRVVGPYIEIDLLIETPESIRKNYMLAR